MYAEATSSEVALAVRAVFRASPSPDAPHGLRFTLSAELVEPTLVHTPAEPSLPEPPPLPDAATTSSLEPVTKPTLSTAAPKRRGDTVIGVDESTPPVGAHTPRNEAVPMRCGTF